MGDWVRRSDNARWGVRTIRPDGRVRWLGRWFKVEDGTLSVEEYSTLPRQGRTYANRPRYDGRMDGARGLFYTYGDHHAGSRDHVYLHSIVGAEWPGPSCVDGFFVWETFALEPAR
jgi:hypothetical protein